MDSPSLKYRNHSNGHSKTGSFLAKSQTLDYESRSSLCAKKKSRDRLIRLAQSHPEWVLGFTGEAGYIFGWNGQNVLIQDRFFVGGDNLRGFQSAGIGPRDSVSGDALGGQKYYLGSVTLGVPLGLPKEFGISG